MFCRSTSLRACVVTIDFMLAYFLTRINEALLERHGYVRGPYRNLESGHKHHQLGVTCFQNKDNFPTAHRLEIDLRNYIELVKVVG